ncbi:M10 family metallopeptidase C-terminal domain-containing protein [Sphingomonas sabuli]|uniref:M10 family metallopeptidase C-terminal domain-containing protein n=1 Tax=Sphingomonas sabuli TaxID=2764186 RepID=A0A7G9L584_9SPHN|nr:M10 family metallopeptidase C-terminal domain-containing protein [Sphingomonas sabuli]QNM83783.1 M10 family metallopeptidase C-terminal domain-containing protein [Sphingomonas sabuli]
MVDIPADSLTTTDITVGGTLTNQLEVVGDHDWIRIELTAGQRIVITLNGSGANPLEDPYLFVRNAAGTLLAENDDSGSGRDSRLVFTATTTGVYYLDIGAYDESYAGQYTVTVQPYTAPPVYSLEQAANQLTHGFWNGDYRHFDVSQGDSITVNLTALTAAGQNLARAALQLWTDIIGVEFDEVATGGQIVFDDSDEGAYSTSSYSNHIISRSEVNVDVAWLTEYGANQQGYAFQAYIHEIGHALGLGHAGDYNSVATYDTDALFANDAWSTSIMSYFSQTENAYFVDRGFDYNFALTPMSADILAMRFLYGLSTTTREGNTTYGTNWTNDSGALTIFDSGGIDTIDLGNRSGSQLVNLNSGTFSNVLGETGNIAIAPFTVIENARTGTGADTLIGNSAANFLDSGSGNDTLQGNAGDDRLAPGQGSNTVNGGAGSDTVDYSVGMTAGVSVNLVTGLASTQGGAGTDTLISIENVRGTTYADTLQGNTGNNVLDGRGGSDTMTGLAGDDTYYVDAAGDSIAEVAGGGSDTVYSSINFALAANIENLILTGTAVSATGNGAINRIVGNASNNILNGGAGADIMRGGAGNDTYYVDNVGERLAEFAGQGRDLVYSSVSFALSSNFENLTLTGSAVRASGNNLANQLTGTNGNNVLNGGLGADVMTGAGGNDIYYVENAGDHTVEASGGGRDRVYSTVAWSLEAAVEDLFLRGTASIAGRGNAIDNVIVGNGGNNVLDGRAGADSLRGSLGSDTFTFRTGEFGGMSASTADRVMDFSHAQGDRLDFHLVDANAALAGDQAFAFIGTGAFTGAAGQLRYQMSNGNTYVYGDTNGDGAADFMVRLDGSHTLVGGDFIL